MFHPFHTCAYNCQVFWDLFTPNIMRRYQATIKPKIKENSVSVQKGCWRFLDSYRFPSSSFGKFGKSWEGFTHMVNNGFWEVILKIILAYPFETFEYSDWCEELLGKLLFNSESMLSQSEEIKRTYEINKFNVKPGKILQCFIQRWMLCICWCIQVFCKRKYEGYVINSL